MKFSVTKEVLQMLMILEKSPHARRFAYAVLGIPYLLALAGLIHAAKWW